MAQRNYHKSFLDALPPIKRVGSGRKSETPAMVDVVMEAGGDLVNVGEALGMSFKTATAQYRARNLHGFEVEGGHIEATARKVDDQMVVFAAFIPDEVEDEDEVEAVEAEAEPPAPPKRNRRSSKATPSVNEDEVAKITERVTREVLAETA